MVDASRLGFRTRKLTPSAACSRRGARSSWPASRPERVFECSAGATVGWPRTSRRSPGRILELVQSVDPTVVWMHPYEGGHPDHDAAAVCAHAALALRSRERRAVPAPYEFTSYHAGQSGEPDWGNFSPPTRRSRTSTAEWGPHRRSCGSWATSNACSSAGCSPVTRASARCWVACPSPWRPRAERRATTSTGRLSRAAAVRASDGPIPCLRRRVARARAGSPGHAGPRSRVSAVSSRVLQRRLPLRSRRPRCRRGCRGGAGAASMPGCVDRGVASTVIACAGSRVRGRLRSHPDPAGHHRGSDAGRSLAHPPSGHRPGAR